MSKRAAPHDAGVRFLCEHPTFIKPILDEPGSPHPMGLGIKNNYTYSFANLSFRLPKSPEGYADLAETTRQPIESLDETYRPQAWRALLVAPKLLEMLPDPLGTAHAFGVDADHPRGQTLHALAVATVVHPPLAVRTDQGMLNEVPVAGVGCLFMLVDAKTTHRAWLRADWTITTRSLSRAVENLCLHHGLELRNNRRRALLLANGATREDIDKRLTTCATVLGFDLVILRDAEFGKAAEVVRKSPPAVILAQRSAPPQPEVWERVKNLGKEVFILPDENPELLLEEFRERLTITAFLTAALRCRPYPKNEAGNDQHFVTKADLPIVEKGQQFRHVISGFHYVENLADGLFYTHDRSNHSTDRIDNPVAFKRYRATASGLAWVADLDKAGREIGEDVKHKGPKYMFIPWKDLVSAG